MVTIDALTRALHHVRRELATVGLLGLLDDIDVELALWPSGWWGELGFVYDRGVGGLAALAGFREGAIYVPYNAPIGRARGVTLRDVLRHEYAHALAWRRPSFVRGRWFRETFGAGYDDAWDEDPAYDAQAFVSAYATTAAKEDFAETFAVVLRESGGARRARLGGRAWAKVQAVRVALRARGRVAA